MALGSDSLFHLFECFTYMFPVTAVCSHDPMSPHCAWHKVWHEEGCRELESEGFGAVCLLRRRALSQHLRDLGAAGCGPAPTSGAGLWHLSQVQAGGPAQKGVSVFPDPVGRHEGWWELRPHPKGGPEDGGGSHLAMLNGR